MARYVVLDFRDNEFAETFVKLVDGSLSWEQLAAVSGAHAEVAAVFAKPTLFCTCGVDYTAKAFQKSSRFGWFVHLKCKRPTEKWGRNIKFVLGQAHNILKELRENAQEGNGAG